MRSRGSITTETVNVMWDTDMIEANGYGNTYIHRLGACAPERAPLPRFSSDFQRVTHRKTKVDTGLH